MKCNLCPRTCNVDRDSSTGYCGAPNKIIIAKTMLHHFEEPVISGTKGSGAVFFSGCNLGCCFCQNSAISRKIKGVEMDENEFYLQLCALAKQGAHNINLITATPYVHLIKNALKRFKNEYRLPIIYNCGGYESVSTLQMLEGLVDVYLPDYKFFDGQISNKYAQAKDYNEVALCAIKEMLRQQPQVKIKDSLITNGVIIRHLVLPSHADDSEKVIRNIASQLKGAWVSLMSQYTPFFNNSQFANLNRRVTLYEYNKVLSVVQEVGLKGFCQDKSSATQIYTPDF